VQQTRQPLPFPEPYWTVYLQAACAAQLLLLPAADAASALVALAAAAAADQVPAAGGGAVGAVDLGSCASPDVTWRDCVADVDAAAEIVCVEGGLAARHTVGLEPLVGASLAVSLLWLYC